VPYEKSVRLVRDSLTENTFADLRTEGEKLKLDEAVALALEETYTKLR
jgi:hypothetical protein